MPTGAGFDAKVAGAPLTTLEGDGRMRIPGGGLLAVLACCTAAPAWAQVTVPDEYGKTIKHHNEIATLTGEFGGDHIDLSTGRLDIVQTDIDLAGNNALPVRVARRFQPADKYNSGHFGIWTMDLPSIHGTFAGLIGSHWAVQTGPGTTSYNRCTNFLPPPFVTYQYATFDPSEYWHGNMLHLPGGGDRELLLNGGHRPADGRSYPVGTKEGDAVRCVPLAATSLDGAEGEGFEVVTTDGVVYTLNQMVIRSQSGLSKTISSPTPALTSTAGRTSNDPERSKSPSLPREDVILFPTLVTDRFGNTVTYQWSPTNPWQLLHIVANDGRHLDFTYESATSNLVTAITDGAHTWTYGYSTDTDTLTLPDGGMWSFRVRSLYNMSLKPASVAGQGQCANVDGSSGRTGYTDGTVGYTGSITGPSGATVTIGMARVLLGRSYAVYECWTDGEDPAAAYAHNPYLFLSAAVVSKTITGPGLPAGLTWRYSYGPTNNCWNAGSWAQGVLCTPASPTTRQVLVTAPEGDVTRYTFGNKYNDNEGLLLKTEYGWNGASALRTVDIEYGLPTAAPYAAFKGESIRLNGDAEMTGYPHPQRKVVTTQQGRTFTWQVASDCAGVPYCFDAFVRPTKVVKSSATP